MRKTILFGLAAAMLATACSEEDDLRQGIAGEGITFTSSVMSRATDTSFEPEDAIGVSMYTESGFVGNATNVQYTTADGRGFTSTNPMTWGAAGSAETVDFKGVYPYKAEAVADGNYSFTLATGEGASLSDNDVMYSSMTDVAVGSNNVNLTFKHKLVKVVMQVYDQNRNLLPGATVKINNQQTSGTLNLADGTVTSTGDANATLNFAINPVVEGEYQTIVMPSAATQGRVITITYKNVDYPCPVDMYAFDSGSKMIFSVTLNLESGIVSEGTPVGTITPTVHEWTDKPIESGWIFGEGANFDVEGKISYQLLTEPTELSAEVSHFGNFGNKQLDATDVYSLEYKRDNAADDATITISDQTYTLQAGLTSGILLIAAGDNKKDGINVTSEDAGITLTSVLVYTNVGLPITLWEGDGTPGNGTAGETGIESAGWRLPLARFTLNDQQLKMLTPGAILRCYFGSETSETEAGLLWLGILPLYSAGSIGSFEANNHCLINVVTLAMCDEVEKNNGEMIFVKDWSGSSVQLSRIELVPLSDDAEHSNLLWCHEIEQKEIGETNGDCFMDYGNLKMGIPASLTAGDIIRISYSEANESAYLEGVPQDENTVIFRKDEIAAGDGTVDIQIDNDICNALLDLRNVERKGGTKLLAIRGAGIAVHEIQLVRGSGE